MVVAVLSLRAGDGIHFSLKGQQIIAQHVFSRIHLQEESKEDNAADDIKDKNTVIVNETNNAHP